MSVCIDKIKHPTEKAAKNAMRGLQRARKARGYGRLHVYHCPRCKRWHVGHQV